MNALLVTRILVVVLAVCCCAISANAAEPSKVKVSSFVVLTKPTLPSAAAFRAALETRLKGRLTIDAMESDDEKVILLRVRGGTVMVGLIGAPLPSGQVDDLCRGAWYWKAACGSLAGHQAHLYVATFDTDLDLLDANLLQTDVVAALMDANAIASYWSASLQSKDDFLRQSVRSSRDKAPVWLWINFRMSKDPLKGWSTSN